MPASDFLDGQGTQLFIDTIEVKGIRGVNGIGSGQASERDRTTMATTGYKEFGIGLQDPGNVTADIYAFHADPGQQLAYAAYQSRTAHNIRVKFSNNNEATFQAYIRQFTTNPGTDADVTGQIQFRLSGAIVGPYPAPS